MVKEIGGYFSLELQAKNQTLPALEGILLNTGRNSIEYILRSLQNVRKVYLPYFTCDSVLEPFDKLGISYEFYHIDFNFEIASEKQLGEEEYLLYTNYFGIKDAYVKELDILYGDHLIVDNAQALYATPTLKCAYSPRKYVGIPDGGIAFTNRASDEQLEQGISYNLCEHLLKRIDCGAASAYADFKSNSKCLSGLSVQKMSLLTQSLMGSVDFEDIRLKRRLNYRHLHKHLKNINGLSLPDIDSFACPMVYPLYVEDGELRSILIQNKIFVAIYWPNVLDYCKNFMVEYDLSKYILPLPIDQRYDIEDMDIIISVINKNI